MLYLADPPGAEDGISKWPALRSYAHLWLAILDHNDWIVHCTGIVSSFDLVP